MASGLARKERGTPMTVQKVLAIIFGVFMIVGGLYCMFTPTATFLTLGWCIGLTAIFNAIGYFSLWWQIRNTEASNALLLVASILSLVFGILVLVYPSLQIGIDIFIAYFLACWLIAEGIILIARAFKLHKYSNGLIGQIVNIHWYVPLCLGILTTLIGCLCVANPDIVVTSVGFFIGLSIIFMGADIVSTATCLQIPDDRQ